MAFDPLILAATSITEGPFLAGGGTTDFIAGTIDNTGGTIVFTAGTLLGALAGVSGDGTLATIGFQALSTGTSVISLSNVILLDAILTDITADTVDGSVTVRIATAVPEPSTWVLLATGCTALLAYGWGRRRQTG